MDFSHHCCDVWVDDWGMFELPKFTDSAHRKNGSDLQYVLADFARFGVVLGHFDHFLDEVSERVKLYIFLRRSSSVLRILLNFSRQRDDGPNIELI